MVILCILCSHMFPHLLLQLISPFLASPQPPCASMSTMLAFSWLSLTCSFRFWLSYFFLLFLSPLHPQHLSSYVGAKYLRILCFSPGCVTHHKTFAVGITNTESKMKSQSSPKVSRFYLTALSIKHELSWCPDRKLESHFGFSLFFLV